MGLFWRNFTFDFTYIDLVDFEFHRFGHFLPNRPSLILFPPAVAKGYLTPDGLTGCFADDELPVAWAV